MKYAGIMKKFQVSTLSSPLQRLHAVIFPAAYRYVEDMLESGSHGIE
jgi:hypothetical protein